MASIVVIGAGMGGMAAAARLSAGGHQVHVIERSATYGGKVGDYARDGFRFDTGPSLFTLPAVYRDLFLKTAVSRKNAALEDNVDLQALDPAFGYRWADGTEAVLPGANTNRVAQALGDALGGEAARDWRRIADRGAQMWAATRVRFLQSPVTGPWQLARQLGNFRDVRTVAPGQTLRGLGRRCLGDQRLRQFLDRYATYSGSDPRRAPAALATIPYVEQTFGAWHIGGGLRELATALHRRCQARGVTFSFDTAVTRISTTAGRVSGVQLADGRAIAADVVVANADASQVYGELVADNAGLAPQQRLRRATRSSSAFILLLALRGSASRLQHHNVFFSDDYDAEFDAIFGPASQPVADPTLYVCCPGDPAMRPDSAHEGWTILANAPRHDPANGVDWEQPGRTESYADKLLDLLAERGVDVRNRVLWREARTPATLERDTATPGGAIYGTSSNGRRAAFLRPANRSPVRGLFLVGGSAHPGGGLPLVGMSAEIVSNQIGDA